jgi:uncharacterized membrane protein YfcA
VGEHSSLVLALTGGATGLVGSLLGLGGGVFLVPLLTLAMGVPIRAAIAASLVSVIATASAASTVNLERGLVNMRLGMALEAATTVGGLGGGIVKVPVLNAFCGIPIRVATATSAFMIGVTAAASVFLYYGRGDLSPELTAAVAVGALPASLLGARLSRHVEARFLKIAMALVLLAVGCRMGLEGL